MLKSYAIDCPVAALDSRLRAWLEKNQGAVIDPHSIRQTVFMDGSTAMVLYSFLYSNPNEAYQL